MHFETTKVRCHFKIRNRNFGQQYDIKTNANNGSNGAAPWDLLQDAARQKHKPICQHKL